MHLVIGNKRYSSWSMRPWLVLAAFDIPFTETVIPLDQADTRARILEHSPSGRVPCLIDGEVRVWDSLAIVEYLAERFPDRAVWPRGVAARAHARSVAAEMHSGFAALRKDCPMHLGRARGPRGVSDDAKADVARIVDLWRDCRARFGAGGPFLFGGFSAADAVYAPVVTRLDTYDWPVEADVQAYMEAVFALPVMMRWREEAAAEPWRSQAYDSG
jgi:glutathione S-transferase